jgi:DNA-binding response OmpR family regulator
MARLRAVLRRLEQSKPAPQDALTVGNLMVRLSDYAAQVGGQPVALTKKRAGDSLHPGLAPGKVFSRDNLLESLWGYDYFGDTRTVDSHIKRLRAKLDAHGPEGWAVRTIWGVGYKFEVGADEE